MFHTVTFGLGLYVVVRFLWPLPWPKLLKTVIASILLLVSVHHLFNRLVFGDMFSPEVPREMIVVVNWIFGSILLIALSQFVVDVFTAIRAAIKRRRVFIPVKLRYGIGIVILSLTAFGVGQAIKVPSVKEVEIVIPSLPEAYDGYHLVQLTDLHISRLFQEPWVEAVVKRTNALNPDLIVATGDLIDGVVADRERDVAPLQGLTAKDGVFVVSGNHEYYFGYRSWMEKFKTLGMIELSNSHVPLKRGDDKLVLAGVNDLSAGRHGFPAPNVAEALEGVPEGSAIILLDHQPKNARDAVPFGVSLQLSGHTHGGLIIGFDRFIASFNNGFVSGLYDLGENSQLYLSNGTALWPGFAIRLGKPPEITSITLRSQASSNVIPE